MPIKNHSTEHRCLNPPDQKKNKNKKKVRYFAVSSRSIKNDSRAVQRCPLIKAGEVRCKP